MPGIFNSLKGTLLLDSGMLSGSFFRRTVVLICQHNSEGAFGLVLNRPTDNSLSEAIVADLPPAAAELKLYVGGPVQPGALTYLYSAPAIAIPDDEIVLPDLAFGHSLDLLSSWEEGQSRRIRVFAGYSGWSGGQLEEELQRDAWVTHPASIDLVFHSDSAGHWRHILGQKQDWQSRLRAQLPDDLSSN